MPALITELIDKVDNSELVRDQIAAILAVESAAQQVLAAEAQKDPRRWCLRVFTERSNPWEAFQDGIKDEEVDVVQADFPPIVNVSFESASCDEAASTLIERQKVRGIFNIDCYGYGVAADDAAGGHIAGDEAAALEAQRAMRIVRNILMAGHYTYLGFPRGGNQIVSKRWPQSITMFQPAFDGLTVQQVVAARLALQVDFNEFSPQVVGEELEITSVTVKRKETGEIYLRAQYGEEADS